MLEKAVAYCACHTTLESREWTKNKLSLTGLQGLPVPVATMGDWARTCDALMDCDLETATEAERAGLWHLTETARRMGCALGTTLNPDIGVHLVQ